MFVSLLVCLFAGILFGVCYRFACVFALAFLLLIYYRLLRLVGLVVSSGCLVYAVAVILTFSCLLFCCLRFACGFKLVGCLRWLFTSGYALISLLGFPAGLLVCFVLDWIGVD